MTMKELQNLLSHTLECVVNFYIFVSNSFMNCNFAILHLKY